MFWHSSVLFLYCHTSNAQKLPSRRAHWQSYKSTLSNILFFSPFKIGILVIHSRSQLFATPWTETHQASLSPANSQSLPKFMSIESVMLSNHLSLCHPLLLLPSILPSIRVLSNELALHIRWPQYWSFGFSISPSVIQGWFPLGLTGLSSLLSKELSRVSSESINSLLLSLLYGPTLTFIHDYWKDQLWLYRPLLAKWCLCFLIHCLGLL